MLPSRLLLRRYWTLISAFSRLKTTKSSLRKKSNNIKRLKNISNLNRSCSTLLFFFFLFSKFFGKCLIWFYFHLWFLQKKQTNHNSNKIFLISIKSLHQSLCLPLSVTKVRVMVSKIIISLNLNIIIFNELTWFSLSFGVADSWRL